MAVVVLPDGSEKSFDGSVTMKEVAKSIGSRLAKASLWGEVDQQPVDMEYKIPEDAKVSIKFVTKNSDEALETMRHSCAHVMARAVMRVREDVKLAYGPVKGAGFYYDISAPSAITEDDFTAIEAEMKKIVDADEPFERIVSPKEKAVELCADMNQDFKVEHINTRLTDQDTVSFYQQGEFVDLCRGPHIPSAGYIGAFKLLSIAGAYWMNDENNEQLQRLYATAFFKEKDLDEHLQKLEEEKKRDHRLLGKKHGLFHIDEDVGQGLILWTPKGAFIRSQLQDFISHHLRKQGYDQVFTPHIGKLDLYKTSGHFPYYQDAQFPPLVDRDQMQVFVTEGCSCGDLSNKMREGEIEGFMLKPMNCPHHVKIYDSQPRSYRDLPIRLAEFGTVYRWEKSGQLNGLTRVRGFTQDDAHLFVTEDQLADELTKCIELVKIIFGAMGMENYRVRVGKRDPDSAKYVGDAANWDKAEQACREAAEKLGKPFTEEPGEAAFYGPKIDFVVSDCIGRDWQLGTVQVDYNLPIRFDLSYIGADNQPHRPIMIHRAPFGSMERFIGVLIEHFEARFPMWLAPEQVRVLTVSEKSEAYGNEVVNQFKAGGVRAEADFRAEKLGAKIREGRLDLVPYLVIVGPKDEEAQTVTLRCREEGDIGAMSIADAIQRFTTDINEKVVRQKKVEEAKK